MAIEKYDIGYIEPKGPEPIPLDTNFYMQKVKNSSNETKSWFEKFLDTTGKLFQGLYVGAMGGLDIYERYKMIERGETAKTGKETGQIVVLGQTFDKNMLYVLIGVVIILIVIFALRK